MFVALVVCTVLLALACAGSATMKLRKNEQSVAVIHGTLGVPLGLLPVLASLELAGAGGIVAGLWLAPLGIAAASGLVLYFLAAAGSHLRVGDTKGVTMPLPPLVLSVAVLALRVATT